MAGENEKKNQPVLGEVLSPTDLMLSGYMAMGGGLGGGQMFIPDDPTYVWQQLWWNYPFAMYVYRDLEMKDAKVGGDLEVRKEAVLAKERMVIPASEKRQDKKVAEFIEETLEDYMGGGLVGGRLPFENVLWESLDAIGKGVAIGEIEFANGPDRVFIKNVHFKPQSLFSFGAGPFGQYASYAMPQTGPLRIRPGLVIENVTGDQPLEEQYPHKWFVHTFRPYQGSRWGEPLDREIFWASWIKRAGVKGWLRYLDKGPGTVVARYPDGAGLDEKQIALDASRAIAEEQAVALAKKFEVEVLEHARGNMGNAFKDLVDDFSNKEIAGRILGQTLTSDSGKGGSGSRALGQVHERVAQTKTSVDSKSAMLAVNVNMVWPLVLYNFGPNVQPPMWGIKYAPGADLKLMSDVLYRGWHMGIPTSKKFYYETTQTAPPADEADTLPPPSPQEQGGNPPGDKLGESAAFAEAFAEEHDIDVEDVIAFAEALQKKKFRDRFSSMRLKPPTLKRERFSSLRPSMTKSSDD